MEEDSTPAAGADDGLDLSGEDSQNTDDTSTADSGDDDATSTGDNAPSDSADDAADDTSTTSKTDKKTPTFDKDLNEWAEKRGYGTDLSDRERRIAQDARNSQRDFSKRADANKTAEKLADNIAKSNPKPKDEDDPTIARVAKLENDLVNERQNRQISDFVTAAATTENPVTEAEVDTMAAYLDKTAKLHGKGGVDFLLKDMASWRLLAANDVGSNKTDTNAVAEKARQEERARIAKENKAGAPTRSAKATVPAKQTDELTKIWEDDSI